MYNTNKKLTEDEILFLSKIKPGALLNPRIDSNFKAMFTKDSESSKAALLCFLEAVTEKKIDKVVIRENCNSIGFQKQRNVDYDINVSFDDGNYAEIEMQAFDQNYDFGYRAEYQAARLESTYLMEGDDWKKAPKVFQISILDFDYEKNDKEVVSRFKMRKENGILLSERLNIIFIELIKLRYYNKANFEALSLLEKWAYFLKFADKKDYQQNISNLVSKEKSLMYAYNSLSEISKNQDMWIEQYHKELHERDRRSDLHGAMEKAEKLGLERGLQKGLQKGLQQGLQEGQQIGNLQSTYNFYKNGMITKEQAIDYLGISEIEFDKKIEEFEKDGKIKG